SLCIVGAFALLCVQFWQLQVVESSTFQELATANTLRQTLLPADRGTIYGLGGVVLADNRPSSDVMFVPGDCPPEKQEDVAQRLEELLGISANKLLKDVERTRSTPYTQLLVKPDVRQPDRFRLKELSVYLPGVLTVVHSQRRYPYGKTGGQILGHLNEIDPK